MPLPASPTAAIATGIIMDDKKYSPGDKLRKQWKIQQHSGRANPNKGYVPSHEREGFDESKVIKLKFGET